MILQRGITGFRHIDDAPIQVLDMADFHYQCYTVARSIGGRVISKSHTPDGVPTNFVMAVLDLPNRPLAILMNHHFPIIGLAVAPQDGNIGLPHFVEHGANDGSSTIAEYFQAAGKYQVLNRADLEQPLCERDLALLAPAEAMQIRYWRPYRVGDVIFNFWD
jgi:hypothetical protein